MASHQKAFMSQVGREERQSLHAGLPALVDWSLSEAQRILAETEPSDATERTVGNMLHEDLAALSRANWRKRAYNFSTYPLTIPSFALIESLTAFVEGR